MAIRKGKDGNWIVDISNGFDPITLKQRRLVRKGYKTKKKLPKQNTTYEV